jgi:hypothetical protein
VIENCQLAVVWLAVNQALGLPASVLLRQNKPEKRESSGF